MGPRHPRPRRRQPRSARTSSPSAAGHRPRHPRNAPDRRHRRSPTCGVPAPAPTAPSILRSVAVDTREPPRPTSSRSWPPNAARPSTRPTPRCPRRSTSPTTTQPWPRTLDHVDGATHHPVRLTVVTPPWNFPVAIPAGSTLAALAAGSSVVIKPAPQAERCGAVLVDALHAAGVPRDVLRLVDVDEGDLGRSADRRPARRPAHPHRRVRDRRSCSAPSVRTCHCSPRRAARTPSSSRRAPTSTSRSRTSPRRRSDTPDRSAPPRPWSSSSAPSPAPSGSVTSSSTPSVGLEVGRPEDATTQHGAAHRTRRRASCSTP